MSTWLFAPLLPRPPPFPRLILARLAARVGCAGDSSTMTYCVGMLLDTGLVFLSDSRTSAGVDQISTFRKTAVFQRPGDRVLVLQSAGNLAITQAVTSMLREQIESAESKSNLFTCPNLFEAARCVGDAPGG